MVNLSDVDLIKKYASGDRTAFDVLYLRYCKMISAIADMFLFSGVEKVDLEQEGAMGLYNAVLGYDDKRSDAASFSTFAYMCVKNRISGAVKKRGKLNAFIDMETALTKDDQPIDSPEEEIIKKELFSEKKSSLIGELSAFEKRVFDLYLSGYSYVEIACVLGETPKSVDNALVRIKSKAKKVLPI